MDLVIFISTDTNFLGDLDHIFVLHLITNFSFPQGNSVIYFSTLHSCPFFDQLKYTKPSLFLA